jgi:hypothetical protein
MSNNAQHDPGTPFVQAVQDILLRCPQCQRNALVFPHASVPADVEDGPHGACVVCHIHWRLPRTQWLRQEQVDSPAAQKTTRYFTACYERVDPPESFSRIEAVLGGAPPSPELVAAVMAEAERRRSLCVFEPLEALDDAGRAAVIDASEAAASVLRDRVGEGAADELSWHMAADAFADALAPCDDNGDGTPTVPDIVARRTNAKLERLGADYRLIRVLPA